MAPSTRSIRLWLTATHSTSWDCRLAQSTLSTSLYLTFLDLHGSISESCLFLAGWCEQTSVTWTHSYVGPPIPFPSSSYIPTGSPSTPTVTLTPTSGSLTIQLTTMYPGTREENLQYSISLRASPHSRWQVEQQSIPVTNVITPVSGSTEVALGPGNYSVTVTVTNQHGSTMSVPQAVTVPGQFCMASSGSCCIV